MVNMLTETMVMKKMFIFERSYIKTFNYHKLTKKSLILTHTDIGYFISTTQEIAGYWLMITQEICTKAEVEIARCFCLSWIPFYLFIYLARGRGNYKQFSEPMQEIIKFALVPSKTNKGTKYLFYSEATKILGN